MPSVGMRKTTRVFGARVLRSGRRLWSGPGEAKHMRATASGAPNRDGWIELLDSSGDTGDGTGGDDKTLCKENGWHPDAVKPEVAVMGVDKNVAEHKSRHNSSVGRKWGSVYLRKRKREDSKSSDIEGSCEKKRAFEDKMYGKQFVRKQWRTKKFSETVRSPLAGSCGLQGPEQCRMLAVVVESSSCSSSHWFACFLSLILRYLGRAKLRLLRLSEFVLSEPLGDVFSSHGIHFLRDSPSIKSSGICKIFGARCFIPLFDVNFSAVPFCFMYLHSSLLLRSACLPYVLVTYSNTTEDGMTAVVEQLPCISSDERDPPGIDLVTSGNDSPGKSIVLHSSPGKDMVTSGTDNPGKRNVFYSSVGPSRASDRAVHIRNSVNSHGIQKRSSLRSRRVKKTSVVRGRKSNGSLASNLLSSRHDSPPLAHFVSNRELRSSAKKSSTPSIKELKLSLVELTHDIGSTCCSANILVIEPDKCYRIKGAIVKLEKSMSKQWFLAVKKDGITRYKLTAQAVMRPCSNNRVTHDIIWTEDSNWKLEFFDRRDWLVFKELYKECSDRNVHAPSENIPVPGVFEVLGYTDSNSDTFRLPNSYISVKDDELSRVLAKRTSSYDMDCEDEEWLRKFNESSTGNENWKHLSEESFELIIHAFEKAFYCSPDEYSDEKAVVNLCSDLEREEVVEPVYSYWIKKRKQKRSALVRVFQLYQSKKSELLPKSILRKKRSFKRQARHSGRGKQLTTFLKAMVAEQAVEEQNALTRVQEAKGAASRSEGVAVLKRQRAQLFMENADLAMYKAAMALRVAEAARVAESADAVASFFLE